MPEAARELPPGVDPHRLSDYELIALLPQARRDAVLAALGEDGVGWLERDWQCRARPDQRPPRSEWRVWLVMAGRGFGKTRMGAEWVRSIAERDPTARIALVAANPQEARSVMVEGESGLLALASAQTRPDWLPSRRELRWPNGARASIYGASDPEALRGPQHSHGWADEIAKWPNGEIAWDNLALGLRLGRAPRLVATTTPRPVPLVLRLQKDRAVAITRGRTLDNRGALPPGFLVEMIRNYGGTRLGRQELDGELLADVEGALWTRALLERCRLTAPAFDRRSAQRIVVAVDPPASDRGDACGIIVAGLDEAGHGLVLEDATVERVGPERWARATAGAAERWRADRVIAEANNGGAMVASVLRAANVALPLRLVHASRGKVARAEPVAALYEAGRVRHAGMFAELEDQLCGLTLHGGYGGPGRSPDRADALVWAFTELLLARTGEARLRQF